VGTVFAHKGSRPWSLAGLRHFRRHQQAGRQGAAEEVAKLHSKEIVELDPKQNEMAIIGTTHLVTIMNDHDLLPTHNFRYGSTVKPPTSAKRSTAAVDPATTLLDGCTVPAHTACAISSP